MRIYKSPYTESLRPAGALYEVTTVETVSPTRIVTSTYCVLASGHDEAVATIRTDVPAEADETGRTFQVEKTEDGRRRGVHYSFERRAHDSPTFPSNVPVSTSGERLFLVTHHGHNSSGGKRAYGYTHKYLVVADGYDAAIEAATTPTGEGVTVRYEVRDWPGRIYEVSKEIANPDLDDIYLSKAAERLLVRMARDLTLRRVGDGTFEDSEGKSQKPSIFDEYVEHGLVEAAADDANRFVLTPRARRYIEYQDART